MVERFVSWWRRLVAGGGPEPRPFTSAATEPRQSTAEPVRAEPARRPERGKRRGGAVTLQRTREVAELLAFVRDWAPSVPEFRGIALVGAWATDTAAMDSDIGILCLCDDPEPFLRDLEWTESFGYFDDITPMEWDGINGLRFELPSSLGIDWGFVSTAWARTTPVDPETRELIEDGFSILDDPDRRLTKLVHACDALRAAEYRQTLNERG